MTYIQQTGDTLASTDGGDQYTGLDRFGRVIDQNWVNTGGTSTDRFQYGYDRGGDVLYKNNLLSSSNSELYHANGVAENSSYDNLYRLSSFARGTLSASGSNGTTLDTVSTASHSQSWSLDAQGSATSITTDGTAQTRTVNSRDQLTGVGSNTLTFDYNGNTTTDDRGYTFVYDAWNRLIQVKNSSGTSLITYQYDALGRRVVESPASGTASDLYYSKDWQVLEEQQGGGTRAPYVWGLASPDELVLRDRDADGSSSTGNLGISGSGLEERLYVQQDAIGNVTALVDTTGAVKQRFVYDPYGAVTVLSASWSSTTDGYAWRYLFQGGRLDLTSSLYNFRNRDYSPTLQRWMQSDPAGYVDGARGGYGDAVRFDGRGWPR